MSYRSYGKNLRPARVGYRVLDTKTFLYRYIDSNLKPEEAKSLESTGIIYMCICVRLLYICVFIYCCIFLVVYKYVKNLFSIFFRKRGVTQGHSVVPVSKCQMHFINDIFISKN